MSWRIEIPVSEQLVETTQAGIGIDKCMVSIRGTATGPTFFTTYENPVEPDISQEFTVFKNIYNSGLSMFYNWLMR